MSGEIVAADLLEILRCPLTGQPLTIAPQDLLDDLNRRIAQAGGSGVRNRAGNAVEEPMQGALLLSDASAVYPVREGIAVLLIDEAVLLPLH